MTIRLQVARPHVDVGGQVRGRLDPGVGEHRDHRGVDDVDDARVGEEVELGGEPVGVQDGEHADDDHRQLQGDVGEREHARRRSRPRPVTLRTLSRQAATITRGGDPDLPARVRQVAGDRLQVVGDGDRGERGDDQVVDQDRPAGDEGDQLVEGVAGEARGAAALAEHRPALDVGERGEHEEQPGGEEDQRRQAEAAVGDDPEREVDREADRRVDGDEEAGHAEAALAAAASEAGGCATSLAASLIRRAAMSQSRPAPIARKASPSSEPTRERAAAGGEGDDEDHAGRAATKTSEKARIEPW